MESIAARVNSRRSARRGHSLNIRTVRKADLYLWVSSVLPPVRILVPELGAGTAEAESLSLGESDEARFCVHISVTLAVSWGNKYIQIPKKLSHVMRSARVPCAT